MTRAVDRDRVKESVVPVFTIPSLPKVKELTARNPVTDNTRRRVRMFLNIFIDTCYTKIIKNAKN
jgi:hypothetical protein